MKKDFEMAQDQTMHHFWLAEHYPAKNTAAHLDWLTPMWIDYMHELDEDDSDEELAIALRKRIEISETHANIFFDIIWSGNTAIGFAFYSVDMGGIRGLIPGGYGYIMELYLLPDWRRRHIGRQIATSLCDKLKSLGCPKVYLTPITPSKAFWQSLGFEDSQLIDPDNQLPIYIKN